MEVTPTLEIAKKSVKQCINRFNEMFKGEYLVENLEQLKVKYEKAYKMLDKDYKEMFSIYTTIDVMLIIMEALSLDKVNNLTLTEEEIKIAAQELYEHWV